MWRWVVDAKVGFVEEAEVAANFPEGFETVLV